MDSHSSDSTRDIAASDELCCEVALKLNEYTDQILSVFELCPIYKFRPFLGGVRESKLVPFEKPTYTFQ